MKAVLTTIYQNKIKLHYHKMMLFWPASEFNLSFRLRWPCLCLASLIYKLAVQSVTPS